MSIVFTDGVTPLNAANLNPLEQKVSKGVPNGYASLDGAGKVPTAQVPDLSGTYQALSGKNAANGYVGLNATSQIVLGGDTKVYRYGANFLATDGNLWAGWGTTPGGATLGVVASGDGWPRVGMGNNGYINFGPGTAPPDANLYREAVSVLRTDTHFVAGLQLQSYRNTPGMIQLTTHDASSTGKPMIGFGNASDTFLYRNAAGVLETGAVFRAITEIYARAGSSYQMVLGNVLAGGLPGIAWGTSNDALMYRNTGSEIRTNAAFETDKWLIANYATPANGVVVGYDGSGQAPAISFGGSYDCVISRYAANLLAVQGIRSDTGGPSFGLSNFALAFNGIGVQYLTALGPDSGGAGYRVLVIPN